MSSLPPLPLPPGITQRYVDLTSDPTCGLKIHILEAGDPSHPLILLFHGYPELAYTWRKMLLPLSSSGYHVVAPDLRGYGRTTGWEDSGSSYARTDLAHFTNMQLLLDNLALVRALGHGEEGAVCVVGHDFGANAASVCTLVRPDLFRRGVFLGHVPTGEGGRGGSLQKSPPLLRDPDVHASLARREQPLKHYQWYNSTPGAADNWENPPQGLKAFLRGYLHLKSHVWKGNAGAGRLKGWTAEELARMPGYYMMPLDASMPDVVARDMQGEDASLTARKGITTDDELDVYVHEFTRTGFQGMLNWYRSATDDGGSSKDNVHKKAMTMFAGKKYEVPVTYIGGEADWGNYQRPGALEALENGETATRYRGTRIFEGAGHWPQVEISDVVCREIIKSLGED